jgi:threonine dehydrogenase-like Zn-dependent dehydrogenase
MLGNVLYGPSDVRCEEVSELIDFKSTDAIIYLSATCICGSDRAMDERRAIKTLLRI